MSTETIVGTILLRERHRRDRMAYLTRIILGVTAILAVSVGGNVTMLSSGPQYRYLMTRPSGELFDIRPLTEAHVDDERVLAWATDAAARINTWDFLNYREQFQSAQDDLTLTGWENLQSALKESGNFDAVVQNRYAATAVPSGPARLLQKGIMTGWDGTQRFAWTVEVPLHVTYRSNKQATYQDLTLRLSVVRMPVWTNRGTGLGIRQIIAY